MITKTEAQYSTGKEKEFIESIGSFSNCGKTRKDLLIGYLKASHKPKDWGSVNRDEVIAFATRKLSVLCLDEFDPMVFREQETESSVAAI
ncbi:MAG: hypothetical protein K2Q13_03945 [Nitrosomonas sp.]|uniref:hypothetical protein n=1 Tax=Nitrosomonas sp. TaxID=42353 RepID=UPI0025E2E8D4|nr:hypothetical protein [Nitrosomonas sp.]MBY0474199.1 hypothetical protein [Nitrosomonas sp.]